MRYWSKLQKIIVGFLYSFLSAIPTSLGSKIRYLAYKPFFRKAGRFSIDTGVTISGFRNIELGDNVNIMKNSYLYAMGTGQIVIGNNSIFNSNVMINASPGKIVIGEYCAIGPNTVIRAVDHSYDRTDVSMRVQERLYNEIILEDDVWVCANCVLTAGVKVGKGSIVGAGAVVTKNVEPFSIVGGVPAKLIRKRK